MGQWAFAELRGDDVRRDPNESELFKTEQTAEGEYAGTDALVREILQNAIDAGCGNGPVRVRLAIHDAQDAPGAGRLAHYFTRLRAPLAAHQIEFNNQGVPQVPCRFLVVEDFGTRGLEGDTLLFHDPARADESRQYFYWFWRNIGRSGRTGDDLGRWGLGKAVFLAASRVGCMFGLTIRQSDQHKLLMGQAVLQIHEYAGKEFKPEGYWCGEQNAIRLPLPIEDEEELQEFCHEWKLSRGTEPGLSVVAPFIHEELKADRLLQAVAVHFFTRIIRGELEVEVVGPAIDSVTLDRNSISAACRDITWDGPSRTKRHVAPPIDFARRCMEEAPAITTDVLGMERIPELTDTLFAEPTLHELRHKFSAGDLVSIRVRLNLPRHTGPAHEGQLDAYLQRTSDGLRCDSYYVRGGMTITKINSQAGKRGVQALVVVDSGPLSELLGDSEGPAHEDWDISQVGPDRKWKTWKGRVKFVRRIVDSLAELLTPPATKPDFDSLIDFFSIPPGPDGPPQPGPGDPPPRGEIIIPPPPPKWFHITQRAGGFTVSRTANVPKPADAALRVSVAYDLPRGNPLRNWSPFDFTISKIGSGLSPTGRGVMAHVKGNVVLLKNIDEEFRFTIEGFDRHLDLFVQVDEVPSTEETGP
jgi:hypothetical protein